MDLTDVIELMSIVDSMDNISEVTVTFGDSPSVSIKKENKTAPALSPEQGFQVASLPQPKHDNSASPKQIKFALDLANKIGNGNMNSVVNGLAHSLEMTVDEILHPDRWADEFTQEHANLYLDILEAQYNKIKKGAWG